MNRFVNKNILIISFNKNKEMKRITTKASNTSNTDQQLFLSPPRNYELFQVFSSDHHFFQYPDHFFFCFKIDFLVNICCSGRIFRHTPPSPIQSLVSLPTLHFYPISFKVSKRCLKQSCLTFYYTNLLVLSYLPLTAHLLLDANLRY